MSQITHLKLLVLPSCQIWMRLVRPIWSRSFTRWIRLTNGRSKPLLPSPPRTTKATPKTRVRLPVQSPPQIPRILTLISIGVEKIKNTSFCTDSRGVFMISRSLVMNSFDVSGIPIRGKRFFNWHRLRNSQVSSPTDTLIEYWCGEREEGPGAWRKILYMPYLYKILN